MERKVTERTHVNLAKKGYITSAFLLVKKELVI
jgi:hypothetical protein